MAELCPGLGNNLSWLGVSTAAPKEGCYRGCTMACTAMLSKAELSWHDMQPLSEELLPWRREGGSHLQGQPLGMTL